MSPRKVAPRRQAFLDWVKNVSPDWETEWVAAIQREIPSYQGMDPEEIHLPVRRHIEALRACWTSGIQNPLYEFHLELARKRVSERVRLADVARAVAVGERLLIGRLMASRLSGKTEFSETVKEAFRDGQYMLLESYQSASEQLATEARALLQATEAGAARTREEWSLLDQILSAMDVGILLMDENLHVRWINRNMSKDLLQLRPELAVGKPCRDVLRHDFLDCDTCTALDAGEDHPPMRVLKRVGGGSETRDFLKVTRRVSGGAVTGAHLMEVFLDITAQQEAQRSLARAQELVRNILNSSVSGIISTDMKGRVTLFNHAAERILGFQEKEMLGQWVGNYYGGGPAEANRVMEKIRSEGVLADYETSFRDSSGVFVPLRATVCLLRDENQTVLGTMGFCQDLRVEVALQREVADRDQYLLTILQASMDGLVTLDAKGCIASWNRGASVLFGVEPDEAMGRPMEDFLPSCVIKELPAYGRRSKGTRRFEAAIPSKNQEPMDLLVTRTEIKDPDTGEVGASLVLKDVTELKRLQRELAEAEHLAELGRLAASVAHEIKNPIAGLRGAMEMMSGVHLRDDPRFAIFQEALLQMRRLDSLVKDLLSFAKPVTLKLEPVPIHLLVESTIPFVQKSAEEAKVTLVEEVDPELPSVMADPQQIQQVLVNLIMNAIQAIEGGGTVTLSASLNQEDLALKVTDTGQGIKPEVMKSIFKPFFTTKHIGTGLGLSIVQRIVGAHGGRVTVESQDGEGTTFTLSLPMAARS
jgi:PAS domain S-box-containing protein